MEAALPEAAALTGTAFPAAPLQAGEREPHPRSPARPGNRRPLRMRNAPVSRLGAAMALRLLRGALRAASKRRAEGGRGLACAAEGLPRPLLPFLTQGRYQRGKGGVGGRYRPGLSALGLLMGAQDGGG